MHPNNISLNNSLIAELFGENLVGGEQTTNEKSTTNVINEQNTIIVEEPHTTYIETVNTAPVAPLPVPAAPSKPSILIVHAETASPHFMQSLSFLKNILAACKLTLQDVELADVITLKKPNHQIILLFGVTPADIGMKIDVAKYSPWKQGTQQIGYFSSLETIEQNKRDKAALWANLQTIFNLVK